MNSSEEKAIGVRFAMRVVRSPAARIVFANLNRCARKRFLIAITAPSAVEAASILRPNVGRHRCEPIDTRGLKRMRMPMRIGRQAMFLEPHRRITEDRLSAASQDLILRGIFAPVCLTRRTAPLIESGEARQGPGSQSEKTICKI